jgi:hypothetical protein
MMVASEFNHSEIENLFKSINEATYKSMIEKSSVDFLEPYLALVENVDH